MTPASMGASRSAGVNAVMISSSLRGGPWRVERAVGATVLESPP
jgi:hypothetical protein